jgi:hypothetical protein
MAALSGLMRKIGVAVGEKGIETAVSHMDETLDLIASVMAAVWDVDLGDMYLK